jgi:hypothetical protein
MSAKINFARLRGKEWPKVEPLPLIPTGEYLCALCFRRLPSRTPHEGCKALEKDMSPLVKSAPID